MIIDEEQAVVLTLDSVLALLDDNPSDETMDALTEAFETAQGRLVDMEAGQVFIIFKIVP